MSVAIVVSCIMIVCTIVQFIIYKINKKTIDTLIINNDNLDRLLDLMMEELKRMYNNDK